MNIKNQTLAIWCGPTFMALMSIGWVLIAGFFPPHPATFTGIEVAAIYNPIC